ncbi:MAG: (d)CMP kinase [Candidatus Krumholzibacteria bacterium]|nr:(d)CMP kinase [Candidatus Krumholzibacteria bacterium]
MKHPNNRESVLRNVVITIDGPSGSGKTTTAREVASRIGLRHVDTGAMYRAVTIKALRSSSDLHSDGAMGQVAESADIEFVEQTTGPQRVLLDKQDVTEAIRSSEATENVSLVSSHPAVRRAMVRQQRLLADQGGAVLEGRDIGSVVLPSADVKIYLDASLDVRAARRCKELQEQGITMDVETVRSKIAERDNKDASRAVSPLKIPVGARVIDTSALTIDDQVSEVERIAKEISARIAGLVVPRGRRNRFRYRRFTWNVARYTLNGLTRILWGLRVFKKDHIDYAENYIYASNHRSNLDPPLIGCTLDREMHFIAKRSLFKNKLFGRLIAHYNAMPMRRRLFDKTAMDQCVALLEQGRSLLIFPEGTRNPNPQLADARVGVGYLALKSGIAVVPIYLDGSNRLRGGASRRPRITIIRGKPIRLTDPDRSKYQETESFREFAQMVMMAIGALKDEYERSRR